MIRPNKSPQIPVSLAARGILGADAKGLAHCEGHDSAQVMATHYLALVAVHAAQGQLATYALLTDDPDPHIVEAADLLDAAARCIAGAMGFPDAISGGDA